MNRRTRTLWGTAIAVGCAAIALVLVPVLLRGFDNRLAPPGKLVVHEWGTFTSFAGSDGVNLEFRPLVTNDLPRFIMRPPSAIRSFAKAEYTALQRMETPVTYFYTDVPRTVNVRVDFPQGMLTEWFPQVRSFESGLKMKDREAGRAYLDWGSVRLMPPAEFAKVRVRGNKRQPVPATLPRVRDDDHYGRARETDSAIVETLEKNGGSHFEKFLFYRGLGNFELPMKLVALGRDRFEVSNSGVGASGAMLLVRIDQGRVRFTRLDPIGPRTTSEVSLPSEESTVDKLADATVAELTAAGLYEKESLAMVSTWRTSWFGETGTRLLYLVPGALTDKLLPLAVEPAPKELVRVLVGRLETLTPEDCTRLAQTLTGSGVSEPPTTEAVQAELETLGRFAEPAIQYVIGQTSDAEMRDRLQEILKGVREKK